jgi:ribonuclease HI
MLAYFLCRSERVIRSTPAKHTCETHLKAPPQTFQVEFPKKSAKLIPMTTKIYTDGSCIGNPGPGGWAFLMYEGEETIRKSGGEPYTTNNRMELLAVIKALKFTKSKKIAIYSDSSWVVKTMTDNWKRKKNLDLWEKLTPLLTGKEISWNWVKGHAGHKENEDCDVRALKEAVKQEKLVRANPDLATPAQKNLFDTP